MNEWKKKREVMQRYDLTAHIYDLRYAEEQAAKIEAALKDITIRKDDLIMDAGCGTGILFHYVADMAESIVGLDISRRTLLHAKKRAKHFSNVHLIQADADNLPLLRGVFENVFAFTLIQNTPNPVETMKQINEVAKDDALIVATGLKNAFSIGEFEGLLQSAGLEIVRLEEQGLKCFVAVCTKLH